MTPLQKFTGFLIIFSILAVILAPLTISVIFWNSDNAMMVGAGISIGLVALMLLFGCIWNCFYHYNLLAQEQKEQVSK